MAYKHALMVRPEFLREHVFPWHERIGRLVRGKGLPYLFHSDGNYTPVIDDLIACGYNALHPCEPSSVDKGRVACGQCGMEHLVDFGGFDSNGQSQRIFHRTNLVNARLGSLHLSIG